ncbi:unnamed protein product [Rotaria sp. Silwood2]|nr:unnamed protein product [Rotaria sp. Silwood2]
MSCRSYTLCRSCNFGNITFVEVVHVHHGKTTLADDLLASNGIISTRLTGKVNNKKYLINLIDTPGHVDFSSEISTVVQLCDGAIILVDVVEGLRSQTLATLRQAWLEHLRIILVFNKIDRLFVEHKWSSHQAYGRIHGVLKHINDVVAKQFTSLLLEKSAEQEVMEKVDINSLIENNFHFYE